MDDYVQYHNSEVMGVSCLELSGSDEFGIVSNKYIPELVNNRVWLIGGIEKPRKYYLCYNFIVDTVKPVNGDFRYSYEGHHGNSLNHCIYLNNFDWFKDLLKSQQNFSLGLRKIEKRFVVELEKVIRNQEVQHLVNTDLSKEIEDSFGVSRTDITHEANGYRNKNNRTTSMLNENRSSMEYARKVFEKLYPNETERKVCAQVLADAITLANSFGSSCWTLSLFPNKMRLNVGQVEVLVLSSENVFLVIDDALDTRSQAIKYRNYIKPSGIHYRSVPIEQDLCHIPSRFIKEIYPKIFEPHKEFIKLAANSKKTTTWKSSFSIGVIHYLENYLKISLPIPSYYRQTAQNQDQMLFPDQVDCEINLYEGSFSRILVNSYERNPEARRICIEHYGTSCSVCGINFEDIYGAIGKDFIHVHHLVPLSEINATYKVDPIKDLRPICPNCHAIIHRRKPIYSIEELRKFLK